MDGNLLLLCMPHCYLDIVQDYCHFFFFWGGSPKIVCTIVGGLAKIVLIRTRGEGGSKNPIFTRTYYLDVPLGEGKKKTTSWFLWHIQLYQIVTFGTKIATSSDDGVSRSPAQTTISLYRMPYQSGTKAKATAHKAVKVNRQNVPMQNKRPGKKQ